MRFGPPHLQQFLATTHRCDGRWAFPTVVATLLSATTWVVWQRCTYTRILLASMVPQEGKVDKERLGEWRWEMQGWGVGTMPD